MLTLLPGLLLTLEAVVYVAAERRLRGRSRWREGALDHLSPGVVVGPVAVCLVAAVVLSTAGWDLLQLAGVLTVVALPIGLGAALRALRGDRRQIAELEASDAGHDLLGVTA